MKFGGGGAETPEGNVAVARPRAGRSSVVHRHAIPPMTLRRFALAALLAAVPGAARAQATLTFPSHLNNPIAGNYYVGPYGPATFVSGLGQASMINVLCVDFLNEVNFGDHYTVDVTNLGGGSWNAVTDTRHPGAADTYRKGAWLSTLFATTPTTGWGSVAYAEWNLFTPAQAPDDATSGQYLALANVAAQNDYGAFDYQGTHYDAVDMSQFWVLTDVNAVGKTTGGKQEFIVQSDTPLGPTATVPEPESLVFVVTGVVALAFVGWRRRDV